MLTQLMPALAQAMRGSAPDAAVRQLMQALGNCNQPLEHRGPVAISPTPSLASQRGGVFQDSSQNIFGDSGPWNPTTIFGSNFSNLQNHFSYNAPGVTNVEGAMFANTIDSRWFSEIFNTNNIYNNQSFVDSKTTNNHFGGDSFLFNNDVEFVSNVFPTTVVMGQPGAPGPPGPSGRDGLAGLSGIPGRNGLDGAAGLDGRDGLDGAAGLAGAAGAVGAAGIDGLAGAAGRPGIGLRGQQGAAGRPGENAARGPAGPPGQDGFLRIIRQGGGGYQLQQGPKDKVDIGKPAVFIPPFTVKVKVPTYTFDAETCDVVPDGEEEIESEAVNVQILIDAPPAIFVPSVPRLVAKPTYP